MSTSLARDTTKIANLRYNQIYIYKKSVVLLSNLLLQGIAKRPYNRDMKQQPTLYTDIIPAYDKEVYSRAQAFVAYYSHCTKDLAILG